MVIFNFNGLFMNKLIEYEFYDGAYSTNIDREKEIINIYERGGWGRAYSLTFDELLEYAKEWDVNVDLNDSDKIITEIATNIILANNAASHNLDPFRFIPKSNKITDPRDKDIIRKFELLFDKYNIEQIMEAISKDKREIFKNFQNLKL